MKEDNINDIPFSPELIGEFIINELVKNKTQITQMEKEINNLRKENEKISIENEKIKKENETFKKALEEKIKSKTYTLNDILSKIK